VAVNSAAGRSILIVDDDGPSRVFLAELLQGAGYSTVEAASGEEAIVAALGDEPALVLLDIMLPGISGYEVCRRLRDRFGEQLPIIFVSATGADAHERTAGLLIGADDYVVKPFSQDELMARVRRLLIRKSPENYSRSTNGSAALLTAREYEILHLLAEGMRPKAIAAQLFISRKTVATHIQRILSKLGVHSQAEAVAVAYREGVATPDVIGHLAAE
jgi:DNA-binding NarL/FixJ family response regulator